MVHFAAPLGSTLRRAVTVSELLDGFVDFAAQCY